MSVCGGEGDAVMLGAGVGRGAGAEGGWEGFKLLVLPRSRPQQASSQLDSEGGTDVTRRRNEMFSVGCCV